MQLAKMFLRKLQNNIRDSNAFVPFITQNSLNNQWVNQEIGYAYCWMEDEGIDPPYFFPVVEHGLEHSVRGFLGIPVMEIVPLNLQEPKHAIHKLLLSLRKYIDRNWSTLDHLVITCASCGHTFSRDIPKQETVEAAIEKSEPLETECPRCEKHVNIDSYTLLVEGQAGGRRW